MERKNLWAPWRIGYILDDSKKDTGCFLCHHLADTEHDHENRVLWRTGLCIVVMNRYPYNNGHLLIAPNRHVADLSDLSEPEMLEMMKLAETAKTCLTRAVNPQGFNMGINLGHCAGAGLPGHVHMHVVPRWNGDTNFMSVCSDTDVISQSMTELLDLLKQTAEEMGLPHV